MVIEETLRLVDHVVRLLEAKKRDQLMDRHSRRIQTLMNRYYDNLEDRIMRQIEPVDRVTSDHFYDRVTEAALIAYLLMPEMEATTKAGIELGFQRTVGRVIGQPQMMNFAKDYLRSHAIRFSEKAGREISMTTNVEIRDLISKSLEEGWDKQKFIQRMGDLFDFSKYRAETTGQTETRHALVASTSETEKRLGIDQWDWIGCNTACETCGPFIQANPHTKAEIDQFNAETHPNCVGDSVPIIPEDFEPEMGWL
jgi:hypothetical protein